MLRPGPIALIALLILLLTTAIEAGEKKPFVYGEKKCAASARECEGKIREMLTGKKYLGVTFYDADHGIMVKAVMPDSPAEKAGLRAGDRVMAVNNKDCSTMKISRFKGIILEAKERGRLSLLIKRGGDFFRVKATLTEMTPRQIDRVVETHKTEAHASGK